MTKEKVPCVSYRFLKKHKVRFKHENNFNSHRLLCITYKELVYNNECKYNSFYDAFKWVDTDEGVEFWKSICEMWWDELRAKNNTIAY